MKIDRKARVVLSIKMFQIHFKTRKEMNKEVAWQRIETKRFTDKQNIQRQRYKKTKRKRERKRNLICYILKLQSSVKKLCSQVQKFSPSKIKFKIKIQVQIRFFIFIRSTDCTFNQNEAQIMHSWFGCSFNSFRFCSEIYSIIFEFGKL